MSTNTKKRGPRGPISKAHKDAMAVGRIEGAIVRKYLNVLRAKQDDTRPGRKRTAESISAQLKKAKAQLESGVNPVDELHLIQQIANLEKELAKKVSFSELDALEAAFIQVAKHYSERKGISYHAWRAVGVEPRVLKDAGITRAKT